MSVGDERQHALLHGPVGGTLVRLAIPMALGIAAIMLFNIVDTFWVGRLGAAELAAMSFTFPVVMVVFAVTMGVGLGTTAVIARTLGNGRTGEVKRLATDALLLAAISVFFVAGVGVITIDPLFALLGADPATVELVREYMVPWYLGVGLLVVPMVGNSAIRATGDTKTPSYVMIAAGLVNAVLDPLLIFGWGPFPALGLTGAALSTVASYGGAMVVAVYVLARRDHLLTAARPRASEVLRSWRRILRIGLPAAGTNLLAPVAAGVLVRFVSEHGELAVAAYGVATRLESLSLIGISALATAMTPFVAQNLGAGNPERIRAAVRFALRFALVWGAAGALVLGAAARPLAMLFNGDPGVVEPAVAYLRTVPASYGLLGGAILVGTTLNALDEPIRASSLVAVRLVALAIPLAWLGSELAGLGGLFGGIAGANVLIGVMAALFVRHRLSGLRARAGRAAPVLYPEAPL